MALTNEQVEARKAEVAKQRAQREEFREMVRECVRAELPQILRAELARARLQLAEPEEGA